MQALATNRAGREARQLTPRTIAPAPRNFTVGQRAVMEQRARMLAPMLRAGSGTYAEAAEIAEQHGLSPRHVWRLYVRYQRARFCADVLAPKPREDRGRSRVFEQNPQLRKFVLAKWRETPNVAAIADAVAREYGDDAPSYGTVNRFLLGIPGALRDLPRLPKQKWDAKYAPYLVTGRGQNTRPNQVWVADHRIYDVLVMNDCFDGAPHGAAVRLWETCIQDMRTRVIAGSVWNVTPSWQTIASALRVGIGRFGKPEIFYADNGKDFRKVGAGAQRGSLLNLDGAGRVTFPDAEQGQPGLLARLQIKVSYCTPRHPQAKQIESYFNFVAQRFDKLFSGQGYTGPKPEMRPDFCREAEKQHREYLNGQREKTPLVAASFFTKLHAQFVAEFNREWKHGGRGMDGRAPLAVMDELLPAAQRRIPNMQELAPLFWDVQKRMVRNCKVELDNATYSAALDDPQGQQNLFLAQSKGKQIAVHRDPSDMACALAFEDGPSGALLARLVSDELAAQGNVTADAVKAISRQRARLRRAATELVESTARGVPSELDLLAQRGGIQREPARARQPRQLEQTSSPFISDAVREAAKGFWEE